MQDEQINSIIKSIKEAVLSIQRLVNSPNCSYATTYNESGEKQLELDLQSDKIIENTLSKNPFVAALVSEEKKGILGLDKNKDLIVAYDPLDGSSLLDVNFSVGSIFAIYEKELIYPKLKAAVYSIYGPRLELVICVDEALLYRYEGEEFIFSKKLLLSEKGKINATGGSQRYFSSTHRVLIAGLFNEDYRLRYSGAMVSDLHHILLKGGGLFSYPATKDAPNGKLRALFEVFPFAYIFSKANGFSSDGQKAISELRIEKLHDSTPCFFGSKYEIDKVNEAFKRS